jgi:hypothetical protein
MNRFPVGDKRKAAHHQRFRCPDLTRVEDSAFLEQVLSAAKRPLSGIQTCEIPTRDRNNALSTSLSATPHVYVYAPVPLIYPSSLLCMMCLL